LNDRRLQRLSAEHYRAFMTALMWAVANRTDGRIERGDVGLIRHLTSEAAKALTDVELFTAQPYGWFITDFMDTQTSRAQLRHLDEKRTKERERKARQRAAAKSDSEGAAVTNSDVPPDVPQDVRADDTGQDRTGQDRLRTGQGSVRQPAGRDNDSDASPNGKPHWAGGGSNPYEEYV
jgi:hypothetical protein